MTGTVTATPTATGDLTSALRAAGVTDVDDSTLARAAYSTDASLYRVPPQVVVRPRDRDELLAMFSSMLLGGGQAKTEATPALQELIDDFVDTIYDSFDQVRVARASSCPRACSRACSRSCSRACSTAYAHQVLPAVLGAVAHTPWDASGRWSPAVTPHGTPPADGAPQ